MKLIRTIHSAEIREILGEDIDTSHVYVYVHDDGTYSLKQEGFSDYRWVDIEDADSYSIEEGLKKLVL